MIDKNYTIKLDLNHRTINPIMKFSTLDENTSTLNIQVTRNYNHISLNGEQSQLLILMPNKEVEIIEGHMKNNFIHIELPKYMTSIIGLYECRLRLVNADKKEILNMLHTFEYEVIK